MRPFPLCLADPSPRDQDEQWLSSRDMEILRHLNRGHNSSQLEWAA